MHAGDLRSRVTFAQRAATSDGYGNALGDWADQFTVAARIQPRLGGEAVLAARLQGTQPVTIRVRQSSQTREIDATWRAIDARKGTVFNIRSVVDPYEHTAEHGRWIDILAEAGVAF